MAIKATKYVYFFGDGKAEGNSKMRELLGGKGAGLADMTSSGVPVPSGFTITTDVCRYYYKHGKKFPKELNAQINVAIKKLEKSMDKKFGDKKNPLLVSVRSGSSVSMPGMMDTVLNLGLNDITVEGLASSTGNERFAYDSYRRFIMMFANVVLNMDRDLFEHELEALKHKKKFKFDTELTVDDLKNLIVKFKQIVKKYKKIDFPQDAMAQLIMTRDAVFNSWNTKRAITYRKINKIEDHLGTGVNIQAMVFGNMGEDSGTGVGFTRNPSTGKKEFYGEFLLNAQGEDVVAGIRTPIPIIKLSKVMPKVFNQLKNITTKLEKHYRDIQDFEFTIEKKKLYMLQTRSGKRTAKAAVKIAVDMVKEKLITKEEALLRVDPASLDQLLHPVLDPSEKLHVIAKGLPASPGAVTGRVVFTANHAVEFSAHSPVILVRIETSPDDIHGMDAAYGILTSRGGMTSHAAVVARGMGKCCVSGCEEIKINYKNKTFKAGNLVIKEKDWITLDGGTGQVIKGKVKTHPPSLTGEFSTFMKWADSVRHLKVRANADIPRDAKVAMSYGAEGIGLCRTEHMFFEAGRLSIVQDMILAEDEKGRRKALNKLLPMQQEDFYGLFEEMKGNAVTIRLIDPPLHEFLPKKEDIHKELRTLKGKSKKRDKLNLILERIDDLHELNPMLGHRGCRLGIIYPEITEMQTKAIIGAACDAAKKKKNVIPEIMIPLIGTVQELQDQKALVNKIALQVMKEKKIKVKYLLGTMIEVPRAAITADEICEEADFFSFGTNDLTQMTLGYSRDDAGKFITKYLEKKILRHDPFQSIDISGVGKLVTIAVEKARKKNKNFKLGVCGEHGGDPRSVKFFHSIGLNYVSCSPFRVPIARLAAAQAALEEKKR